jgi:type II secretory pathway component PulK
MIADWGLRIANSGSGARRSFIVVRGARPVVFQSAIRNPQFAIRPRGMILLVVLVIIALLALLGASFSFRMNADLAAVKAKQDMQQARLAAETGLDWVLFILRENRTDMDAWHNNPRAFRRIPVWMPGKLGGSMSLADQEAIEGQPAWRFSVVSYTIQGDNTTIRYGINDEASKVNLNTASRAQLLSLFEQIEPEGLLPQELADPLIDWRDEDDEMISIHGAESSYYMTRKPPYRAKNRPLETVEELLMIKNFTGRILYGEDFNRNGYLDPNEDDGPDGAFPPDNGDGVLDRGLLPLVTVYSWDWNTGNDNQHRMNINAIDFSRAEELPEHILEDINPEIIDFIAQAQRRGYRFKSVGELVGLEVYEDGSSNYDAMWRDYGRMLALANRVSPEDRRQQEEEEAEPGRFREDPPPDDGGQQIDPGDDETQQPDAGRGATGRRRTAADRAQESRERRQGQQADDEDDKDDTRQQSVRVGGNQGNTAQDQGNETETPQPPRMRDRRRAAPQRGAGPPSDGGAGAQRGTPIVSPVTAQDMAVLLDRLTTLNTAAVAGAINVNTAPVIVLATIPGLEEDQAAAIVAQRAQVSAADRMTPAWVLTSGAVDPETFALISNYLTSRSIQFTVDVIGFADHVGAACRIQAVVEMRGQLAQIKYYRDITSIGIGYPVHDDERSEGFAFADR